MLVSALLCLVICEIKAVGQGDSHPPKSGQEIALARRSRYESLRTYRDCAMICLLGEPSLIARTFFAAPGDLRYEECSANSREMMRSMTRQALSVTGDGAVITQRGKKGLAQHTETVQEGVDAICHYLESKSFVVSMLLTRNGARIVDRYDDISLLGDEDVHGVVCHLLELRDSRSPVATTRIWVGAQDNLVRKIVSTGLDDGRVEVCVFPEIDVPLEPADFALDVPGLRALEPALIPVEKCDP